MHRVTVVLGPTALGFMFKTKEKAEAHKNFKTDHPTQDLTIDDDFGQHAEIKATSIHGIIIEDMDQAKLAQVELMLHNTRVQAAAQHRAQSDPALNATRRGPAVMTPFNGGLTS
jgi:hypothetical protein